MLILLPPSEGKAVGRRGKALDLDGLSFPTLNPTRQAVLDGLVAVSAQPDALDQLHAPKGAKAQVDGNVSVWSAPTLRASDLYTGVLYDALGYDTLDAAAKRRANRWLVVVSAAFGALRPGDRVPSYRLSMGIALPGVGSLGPAWQAPLDAVLPDAAGRDVIVDLRSSTYVAAWRPHGALAERTVAVHVLREEAGRRTVVSHMAKHTRGLVARSLVTSGTDVRTPEALADALAREFTVELDAPKAGKPRRLEIVELA